MDSDQLASQKPSDLDLHFFQILILSVLSMARFEKQAWTIHEKIMPYKLLSGLSQHLPLATRFVFVFA